MGAKEFYTIRELSERLGCSVGAIYNRLRMNCKDDNFAKYFVTIGSKRMMTIENYERMKNGLEPVS